MTSLHPMVCEDLSYDLLGGTSEYYREPVLVTFRNDEESSFQMYRLLIDIARPTRHKESLPSLLGQDILRNWRVIHDRLASDLTFEAHPADFSVLV